MTTEQNRSNPGDIAPLTLASQHVHEFYSHKHLDENIRYHKT